jgi:hypothetical protein
MFLQLHDGPDMPYGTRAYPYPKVSGPIMPVRFAEDPFAPGSPVMQTTPYRLLSGCDQAQVYAEFVPQNKEGWKLRLNQVSQGQQLVKNYQTLRQAAGTGSAPIYDASGTITGFQQATKAQEIAAYIQLGLKALQLAQQGVRAGEARRLEEDAQKLYNENKWGIADVCNQTLVMLQNNAQNCYDSLNWWIRDQGTPGKTAGQKRIANRSVVIRQNALVILVKEIEARGSSFTPGGKGAKGAAPVNIAAILALVAGAAFLKF